jgi:L-fuconate dehydratase
MHISTAAVVNAVWDLWAKTRGVPVWRLLADLSPEEIVSTVDFRYISDAIAPDEAVDLLRAAAPGREERERALRERGYDDEKVDRLVRLALADGFRHVKMKVGADPASDARRAALIRDALGDSGTLMMDANQVWDVGEAIAAMRELAAFDPWWIEEPTSPDDILGHARIRREIAPIAVATGEHVQNRIVFKQLLQADAIDVVQIDACRVAGVNEVIAILLMAAKFGVRVCPHAGGVGLCEYVQHLAAFDYLSVSGSLDGRVVEWVDHLHEHFVHPALVVDGHYVLAEAPGYSIEMLESSLADYAYPHGRVWSGAEAMVD